ncbi:hypothetical protein MBM_07191 [Drepanopeziza brunnea f. sp. 'multigermtubi' MB_m1]|uniref:Uncharacterized protein n=1 Tax=Marssonina brunnea f. sp. multigermtubi (strain MB_m1) TaxID=1072389 RepID=K1WAZ8_MARBU|nr:uncharacterized protein MBM_07191 [Drepanopeziza brunnea f. sp. 'multigermtubi' MB_m1]EKD14470.1 hypothetical protein MBM_07191 [Drepanopeziza brunnea f. sp. 'multigermtubi' MB_m1]
MREASKLKSLRDYAKMFKRHLQQRGAREGVFAILNELLKGKVCLCMRTHFWQPSSCDLLRLASTGQNPRNLIVSEPKFQAIRERFSMPSYEKLKASLELLWKENGASTSEGRMLVAAYWRWRALISSALCLGAYELRSSFG